MARRYLRTGKFREVCEWAFKASKGIDDLGVKCLPILRVSMASTKFLSKPVFRW